MSQLQRRTIRLKHYDYTLPGAYFVTLCTYQRELLFGEAVAGEIRLSECGRIVAEEWERTAVVRPNVLADVFVVMPNHMHGILLFADHFVGATRRVAPTPNRPVGPAPGSLGAVMGQFKSAATKRLNELRGTPGLTVWQRNYYEHVIRNEADLARIRKYIAANPARWAEDENNLARQTRSSRP